MVRQGWTEKACHGCGSTELHRKDKLCADCQRIFDDGLLARKKQELQQDKIMVKHERAFHLNSGPYMFDHSSNFTRSRLNDRLRHTWQILIMSVIKPAVGEKDRDAPYLIDDKKDIWGVKREFYGYDDDEYFLIEPSIRTSLNELDLSIRLATEYVYLAGKQQGLNLLTRLNEGLVALSSFEEDIMKVEKRLDQIKYILEGMER